MKLPKSQERAFTAQVKKVASILKNMTVKESGDFVTSEANVKTLRALRNLQNEILPWCFLRTL